MAYLLICKRIGNLKKEKIKKLFFFCYTSLDSGYSKGWAFRCSDPFIDRFYSNAVNISTDFILQIRRPQEDPHFAIAVSQLKSVTKLKIIVLH